MCDRASYHLTMKAIPDFGFVKFCVEKLTWTNGRTMAGTIFWARSVLSASGTIQTFHKKLSILNQQKPDTCCDMDEDAALTDRRAGGRS